MRKSKCHVAGLAIEMFGLGHMGWWNDGTAACVVVRGYDWLTRSGRQKSGREKCWLSCLIYTFSWTSESALPILSQKAAGIRSGTASIIITARFCLSATAMQDVSSLPPLPINAANQQILHINPTPRVLISAARAILLISPPNMFTCCSRIPATPAIITSKPYDPPLPQVTDQADMRIPRQSAATKVRQ